MIRGKSNAISPLQTTFAWEPSLPWHSFLFPVIKIIPLMIRQLGYRHPGSSLTPITEPE
jgi:hypothetical protein